jgi:hypothetical protein
MASSSSLQSERAPTAVLQSRIVARKDGYYSRTRSDVTEELQAGEQ